MADEILLQNIDYRLENYSLAFRLVRSQVFSTDVFNQNKKKKFNEKA